VPEIAAGTGVVTRQLASALFEEVFIVATDLNQTMLDTAAEIGTTRPVTWRQADAMTLPFEDAEFADVVTDSLASLFPDDPPRFLARTPHGYYDLAIIERELAGGGFTSLPRVHTLAARSKAGPPRIPAHAYCFGTPLPNEIEERDSSRLDEATDRACEAITRQFGAGPVDGKIQAHIVVVER
jgi:SAM-dependent methyltransferase